MDGVFANRTAHRDFLTNELQRRGVAGRDVYIAVAFFTEADVVQRFLDNGCNVWLIVRLGLTRSQPAGVLPTILARRAGESWSARSATASLALKTTGMS